MKLFDQITSLDITSLTERSWAEIQTFSKSEVFKKDEIASGEILNQIPSSTDCLLISLLTPVTRELIENLPHLKYIGVYGTSLRKIDLQAAKDHGISVRGVSHYCDFETAEFIFAHILCFFRNIGNIFPVRGPSSSLEGKRLGILGLGHVGIELAKLAQGFRMQISYYSRSRKLDLEENLKLQPMELEELLLSQDVVSIHTPPDLMILGKREFQSLNEECLLINTCPGNVLDLEALELWIRKSKGIALFDRFARQNLDASTPGIYFMEQQAYRTVESIRRLQDKFILNLREFLTTSL